MPSKKPHCVYHIIAEKYRPKPGVKPMVSCLTYDRAWYKLSYPDRIQFCYVNSEFILIPRLSYCVCCVRSAGVVHVCR